MSSEEKSPEFRKFVRLMTQWAQNAEQRMDRLAEAQANSEVKIAALADAQIRTEAAVAALSERMAELAVAQAHRPEVGRAH